MEQIKKELQRLASEGRELGIGYAELSGKPYLLIPLFEKFDIAATFENLNDKVSLRACVRNGDEIEGIYGKRMCRHAVINYENVEGAPGKKLGEQEVKLSGLDDLGAFLMSWDAWRQYGNQYGEVFDPQIITQLIGSVPPKKRPPSALRWFEKKTFNDLEKILKWDKPDHEFQKSRHGQALYVLGRMLSTEAVGNYVPVHFLELVKEKLDKYLSLFLDVLKEGNLFEKLGCIHALIDIKDPRVAPILIETSQKDEAIEIRYYCLSALEEISTDTTP